MADKIISDLPSIVKITSGDMLFAIENGTGTFSGSVDDVKDYVLDYAPNKNVIINGDFDIAQRGTSFPAITNDTYNLDRWVYGKIGTMVHTISQDSDVPTVAQAGRLINNSVLIKCTTSQPSLGVSDYTSYQQKIEGYNFRAIAQKQSTLSFWVKATKVGVYCVAFLNSGADRSFVSEYTVNSTNTWELKTVTIDASPSAGTWDYENGIGLSVIFSLTQESINVGTAGSWQNGTFTSTVNQVNACDSTSNDFRITGIQLEEGSIATPFEKRTIQEELILCQRYFQKTYNTDVSPGTVTGAGQILSQSVSAIDITLLGDTKLISRMRSSASITTYSPQTGAAGKIEDDTASIDRNPSITTISETSYRVTSTGMSAGNTILWHHTASAEL